MNNPGGKLLALDFGDNNVGLAVCDVSQRVVFGRGVVRGFGSLEGLAEQLEKLCKEEGVRGLVMGVPTAEDGSATAQTERMERIGRELGERLGLKVEFQDETLTSFEAQMKGKEDTRLRKHYSEHEVAAMIILERFLGLSS